MTFRGHGDVRALCRALDWAATPLGGIEMWSGSLRTAAQMVTGSSFANVILWGPKLIQIYSDDYGTLIGKKHPLSLGRGARESWPELWRASRPMYRRVRSGETVTNEGFFPETASVTTDTPPLTACYSPIRDETGNVSGIWGSVLPSASHDAKRKLQEECERLRRALETERARLEYVFRAAPAFLAVVRGPEHVLEQVNDAFSDLLGRRELIGRRAFDAIPEMREQFEPWMDQVLATGKSFVGREVHALLQPSADAPTGEHFLDFTYVPYIEADGTRSGVIAHGTDVTAHVRDRREVERVAAREHDALSRAEAEASYRDDVLAVVSHDLRNPLATIGIAAQALSMSNALRVCSPQELKMVSIIQRSADAMDRQIRDLLDVASIETGHLALELRDLNPADIAAEAAEAFASAAVEAGVILDVDAASGLPTIHADSGRLLQALGNLLVNALKFSASGDRITVTAERAPSGVRFVVTDTGVGISPAELRHVFDRFWQRQRGAALPSSGLGLAIVRGIVEAHGGACEVASTLGKGTRFSFVVPPATHD